VTGGADPCCEPTGSRLRRLPPADSLGAETTLVREGVQGEAAGLHSATTARAVVGFPRVQVRRDMSDSLVGVDGQSGGHVLAAGVGRELTDRLASMGLHARPFRQRVHPGHTRPIVAARKRAVRVRSRTVARSAAAPLLAPAPVRAGPCGSRVRVTGGGAAFAPGCGPSPTAPGATDGAPERPGFSGVGVGGLSLVDPRLWAGAAVAAGVTAFGNGTGIVAGIVVRVAGTDGISWTLARSRLSLEGISDNRASARVGTSAWRDNRIVARRSVRGPLDEVAGGGLGPGSRSSASPARSVSRRTSRPPSRVVSASSVGGSSRSPATRAAR
jgi:hypothetical protein